MKNQELFNQEVKKAREVLFIVQDSNETPAQLKMLLENAIAYCQNAKKIATQSI